MERAAADKNLNWKHQGASGLSNCALDESSQLELFQYFKKIPLNISFEQFSYEAKLFPALNEAVEGLRLELEKGQRCLLLQAVKGLTLLQNRWLSWLLAKALGTPLVQNSEGDRTILVYERDRLRTTKDGARYHQSREGGTIHTDNVNIPEFWEYMVLTCHSTALLGGESILVRGHDLHAELKKQAPWALKILEQDFMWECRGVRDATYSAPIVTYDKKGEPLFRHLRPYMESAHLKTNRPLHPEQVLALDILDSLCELSQLQTRLCMQPGQILMTFDSQALHGRTPFVDHPEAVTIGEYDAAKNKPLKRTFERLWIKKQERL